MMTKTIIFALLFCFCILPLHAEEETPFVDDDGDIYLIDGEYMRTVSRYTVIVKDLFDNGIAALIFTARFVMRSR